MRGLRGPSLALLAAALACAADERTAKDIVAEFRAIRIPWGMDVSEEEYVAFLRDRCGRQCELALELATRFPAHEAVPELMGARAPGRARAGGEGARDPGGEAAPRGAGRRGRVRDRALLRRVRLAHP